MTDTTAWNSGGGMSKTEFEDQNRDQSHSGTSGNREEQRIT